MTEKSIAYVYRRLSTKNVINDNGESVVAFVHCLIDIAVGSEINSYGKRTFFLDDNETMISYIGNNDDAYEEFVYAFPTTDNKMNYDELCDLYNEYEINLHDLEDYLLYQIYNGTQLSNVLAVKKNQKDFIPIEVDPSDYNSLIASLLEESSPEKEPLQDKNVMMTTKKEHEYSPLYADELFQEITKSVIGQDEGVRKICTALCKNQRLDNPYLKQNLLLCGPTGVGKTEVFRCLSRILDVPIVFEDANEFTINGYVGRDLTSILSNLLYAANGDVEKAKRGIVYLDEIDKKAASREHGSTIASTGVLNALLKMIEGHTYTVQVGNDKNKTVPFDTSLVTFISSGAFSGIEEYTKENNGIGFGAKQGSSDYERKDYHSLYTPTTLKKYNLLPEFIGRNKIVVFPGFDIDGFEKIVLKSDKSALLLNEKEFKTLGIKLLYDQNTIRTICEKAMEKNSGARGIKQVIDNTLEEIEYDIYSKHRPVSVEMTPESIENPQKLILRY